MDKIGIIHIRLQTIEAYYQSLLARNAVKHIRKVLTGSEYVVEGTAPFKALLFYRRYLFKSLKFLRRITFLPFTLPVKFFAQGTKIYFQYKLSPI